LSGLADGVSDGQGGLTEDDVIRVLGVVVEADRVDAQSAPSSDDEAPYFGEDADLYNAVSPDAVEVTEASMIAETETEFGADPVAQGTLAGRFWNDVPGSTSDESGGVFRGQWFGEDGDLGGYVRGEYQPLQGENLPSELEGGGRFIGRYVDTEGRFRGFLRGRYGHAPGGRGVFFGRWLDRGFRVVGVLKGHWTDEAESEGGSFAGRWAAFNVCDEARSLPELDSAGMSTDELTKLDALTLDDVAMVPLEGALTAKPSELSDEVDLRDGEPPCVELDRPHGYLRGWHVPLPPEDEREGGVFRGRWRDADRNVLGHLIGRYVPRPVGAGDELPDGVDAAGDGLSADLSAAQPRSVDPAVTDMASGSGDSAGGERRRRARWLGDFYGKYVGEGGELRGFIRGHYGTGPHGLGVFRGCYLNTDGEPLGRLLGRWDDAPDQRGGPFFGIWFGADLDGGA